MIGEEGLNDTRCQACGSFLFSVVNNGAFVHVSLGSLVDAPTLRPTHHIFVGSKAAWFEITDDLPSSTSTRTSPRQGSGSVRRRPGSRRGTARYRDRWSRACGARTGSRVPARPARASESRRRGHVRARARPGALEERDKRISVAGGSVAETRSFRQRAGSPGALPARAQHAPVLVVAGRDASKRRHDPGEL